MIDTFTKEDFEVYLNSNHSPFEYAGLDKGEHIYSLPLDNQTSIAIRSSVRNDSLSAGVGKDSIRFWLESNGKPISSKMARTHRTKGWQDRLTEKINQLTKWRVLAGDCKECNKPKGIFKVRTEENKGRPFAKCREHNGFAWLDKDIYVNDIYFTEESNDNSISKNEQEVKMAYGDKGKASNIMPREHRHNEDKDSIAATREIKDSLPELPKGPNPAQRNAIEFDTNSDLRVLAGPGSGKTFVIALRYEYLVNNGINPQNILVCTFGKEASLEMAKRIQKLVSQANLETICTINALCYRLLVKWDISSRWYGWKMPKNWQIAKVLEEIIGPIWQEKKKPGAKEVMTYINTTKALSLSTDDSYEWFVATLDQEGQGRGEWLYEIRSKFDAWLNRNRFITYADQLYLVEKKLQSDEAWRTGLQERFRHVIVDEGQDCTEQAIRILTSIFSDSFFSVLDPDQTLFRFAGSRPELMTFEIDEKLPDIETIKLEVNYRSQDEIIAKSQQLIAHNYSDLGGPYPQEFIKQASGIKGPGEQLQFQMYENADEEAMATTVTILELIQSGYEPGDFFIGARTRAQLGYLEGALVRTKIPFINITGGSFWQSKHVADVVAYLRLANDTKDKSALERVYNIPSANHVYTWDDKCKNCKGNKREKGQCGQCKGTGLSGIFNIGDYCAFRGLGKEFLAKINYDFDKIDKVLFGKDGWRYQTKAKDYDKLGPTKAQDLQEFVWMLRQSLDQAENVGQIIRVIIDDCYEKYLRYNGMDDEGLANAKLEDLATVEELASKYTDVDKFLSYVDEMVEAAEKAKNKDWRDYVVLSTVHRLKGLERPIVFGLGWCEGKNISTGEPVGLLPHTFSLTPPPNFGVLPSGSQSPVEDERCIAFVCVSRAIKRVYLSGIRNYRNYVMWPSRFVSEIGLEEEKEENLLTEEDFRGAQEQAIKEQLEDSGEIE